DPFPSVARTEPAGDLFIAHEVSAWIERHGLGNNPSLAEDIAMFAGVFAHSFVPAPTASRGVSALLVLRAMAGLEFDAMSASDVLDEADELDPDDEFLLTELSDLGDELEFFAGYVDAAVDAAYNELQAFESLAAQSRRYRTDESPRDLFSSVGRTLLASLGAELTRDSSPGGPCFVDVDAANGEVVSSMVDSLPEELT